MLILIVIYAAIVCGFIYLTVTTTDEDWAMRRQNDSYDRWNDWNW